MRPVNMRFEEGYGFFGEGVGSIKEKRRKLRLFSVIKQA